MEKNITLEQAAEQLGIPVAALKKAKADLKRGKHWTVGRYNKTFITPAGVEVLRSNLVPESAPAEEQPSEVVVGVELVEPEPVETAPVEEQKPQSGFALDRLLAEGETATVLLTRMPNNRILKVNYKGAERICMCKDSRFFVPGMVIPVRLDGDNLVAKFQPRRLGKF